MSVEIPNEFAVFVKRLVDSRRFLSEADVISAGLRMLQARESLQTEVEKGFDELDAGKGVPAADVFDRVKQSFIVD